MGHVPNRVGARLRALREHKGLSRQDLASAGLSAECVAQIERGDHQPSAAVLQTLAERVGCSVEYLTTGRDEARTRELELKLSFADLAIRNGSNGEALQAYSEALAAAPFLPPEQIRRARLGQALAFEKLGRLATAVQLLTALFEAPETVPGSAEWAQLAVALCRCHRNAGRAELGIAVGERAMRLLDTLGLEVTDDHIRLGSTLLSCYQYGGDLAQAQRFAEQLLRAAERSGSDLARGAVYWNTAILAGALGRDQDAVDLAERALVLLAGSDNVRHLAMLRTAYARILLQSATADPHRAKALLEEAHPVLREVGTAAERARNEELLAQAAFQLGDWPAAVRYAVRSIELRRDGAPEDLAAVLVLLAEAQQRAGDLLAAESALNEAVGLLGRLPVSRLAITAWRRTGDLWKLLGRPAEALDAYEKAFGRLVLPQPRSPEKA